MFLSDLQSYCWISLPSRRLVCGSVGDDLRLFPINLSHNISAIGYSLINLKPSMEQVFSTLPTTNATTVVTIFINKGIFFSFFPLLILLSLNHGNVDSEVCHDPHIIPIISAARQRIRKFLVFVVFLHLTTSVVHT